MGTTAEKLNYLNETKKQIKSALETPSDIFRDYPDLIKKYIDNQPTKVVDDGVCDNAVDLPIKTIEVDGNYEQKTTGGRQLFDNTLKDYGHYGTIATTIPTGVRLSADRNETTSGFSFGVYAIMNLSNYVGKTVRMKSTFKANSNLKGTYTIGLCDSNGINRTVKANAGTSGKEISFVVPELETGKEYLGVWFYANAGGEGVTGDYVDYTNVIVTIDNDDMTYEEYTGGISSPNPEYSQNIEVIDGCNRFDYKNYTYDKTVLNSYRFIEIKGLKPNTEYSFYNYTTNNTSSNTIFLTYETLRTSILLEIKVNGNWRNNNTFTTTENGKCYLAIYDSNWSEELWKTYLEDFKNAMLTEGTTQKTYLPHGYIGLEHSGKNKVDFINYAEKIFNSSKVEKLSDGSYKFNHCDTAYTLFEGLLKAPCTLSWYVRNDGTTTTTTTTFNFKVYYEDGTEERIAHTASPEFSLKTKILTKNVVKIVNTYYSASPLTIIKDVQLEEGSTATPYEPYHENKVIGIDLQGNTLAKVGETKDILRIYRNGEVEIEKRVLKVVLDGSDDENYNIATSNKFMLDREYDKGKLFKDIKNDNTKITAISNRLIGIPWDTMSYLKQGWYISIRQDGPYSYLRLLTTDIETTEDLKLFFKEHPTEVYYIAEPQTIKLPSIEPINLWQGTNIFKLITNLSTTYRVEYVVDKEAIEIQSLLNIVEGENL